MMIRQLLFFILSFTLLGNLNARQYDEDFLIQIVESGNVSAIDSFFHTHGKFVGKAKHLMEFIEILRNKLGEKYGYTPTWKEIYEAYKVVEPTLEMPKHVKQWIHNFLKQIVKKTEEQEFGHIRCYSLSFDYQGSLEVDETLDSVTAPAYAEALAGALLMVVPEPYCKAAGAAILTNAAFTIWQHWKEKTDQQNRLDRDYAEQDHSYDPSDHHVDHYDRLTDSEVR